MPNVMCPKCRLRKSYVNIKVECGENAKMQGVIECLSCGHEFPITMDSGYIQKLDIELPGTQSDKLHAAVPFDIKEDVKEAERASYAQCYKACVTLCRRALQLGLIDKGIADSRLSAMLEEARRMKLIEQKTYDLAVSVKGYGDIEALRREHLEPQEVNMVIYATVRMLNEIFP